MAKNKENFELIEINLMFAKLELTISPLEDSATARALYHIEEALTHVREQAVEEK